VISALLDAGHLYDQFQCMYAILLFIFHIISIPYDCGFIAINS